MKKTYLLVLILLSAVSVYAVKIATLTELRKPRSIAFAEEELIVADGPEIFVYSAKDFKLKKRFGKSGDGPKEFSVMGYRLYVYTQPEYFVISSKLKVSIFKRDGTFIRENRISPQNLWFQPMGKKLVGIKNAVVENVNYFDIDIYDENVTLTNNVTRIKHYYQKNAGFKQYATPTKYVVYENKIYVMGRTDDFEIDVFDNAGKKNHTVALDYKRHKLTNYHKDCVNNWYKKHPSFSQHFEYYKKQFKFPDYLPAIWLFKVTDNKIYVLTRFAEKGKNEIVILDLKGTLLKKVMVPFSGVNPKEPNPLFTVNNGKLYHLVDNDETEEWELFQTELK
ncbi:MAG: hypothetical protein GY757_25115 [bacterium]|nr:hypothetical protein [bacterium]